ncbi:MAG: coat protein [Xinjiang sediment betaflexivirus 1]|nr:MAG: coat protein [Xinjiang sediment betaflexivirus 1]
MVEVEETKVEENVPKETPKEASPKKTVASSSGTKGTPVNAVDLNQLEDEGITDVKLLDRFKKLREASAKHLSSGSVVNGGWETGRPPAKVSDQLKGDATNIFTRPSIDALFSRGRRSECSKLATAEEMAKIATKLEGLGVPPEGLTKVLWDVAVYCTGVGSSPYSDPKGVIEFDDAVITRDAVFAVIKEFSTLRKVCRLYAPITWQYMKVTQQPPPDWFAKGFADETKYAAFDFFDAVENTAAVQPLEGILIRPTPEERIANETHKRMALNRNSGNKRFANYSAEITGGMFGCDSKLNWRDSKCQ